MRTVVHLERLSVRDFRSWETGELEFAPGLTVVVGDNGSGKTNLLEAVAYVAQLRSFRGSPTEALVRLGTDRSVLRASAKLNDRSMLFEAEINPTGRSRMLVNKQPLARSRDVRDGIVISVFTPDDLVLVKGGPGERRDYLDEVLRVLHPRNDALLKDLDRVLRQRNALLKQAGGRLSKEIGFTLDVWDAKLVQVGEALVDARITLVRELQSPVACAYADIADRPAPISLRYHPSFPPAGLAEHLAATRNDDVRRQLTLSGPHRDDLELSIETRPSRTHASQGEQRTLALALRLGAHRLLTGRLGVAPILLLDDVFSELDATRSDALVRHLPPGQAILATAGRVPTAACVDATLRIERVRDGSSLVVGRPPVDKPVESVEETAQDHVTSRESSLVNSPPAQPVMAESLEHTRSSTVESNGTGQR